MMKWTTIRYICLTSTAICLLASCAADTTEQLPTEQLPGSSIQLAGIGIDADGHTRTGAADTYDVSLPEASQIAIYIYGSDGVYVQPKSSSNEAVNETWVYQTGAPYAIGGGQYRSGISLKSHKKTPEFPSENNVKKDFVNIFATYPNHTAFTPPAGDYTVEAPIDQTGKDDANIDAIKDADLLTTDGMVKFTKEQCDDNDKIDLQLKHRMAKLTVTFTPKTGSDLTSANMPTKFDVIGVYRSLKVTPSAGTVTTVEADATTQEAPLKGSTAQSLFLPPQRISTTLLKFNILGGGKFKGLTGCTFTPASTLDLEGGHEYLINVTVDVDYASVTGSITSWNEVTMSYDTVVL